MECRMDGLRGPGYIGEERIPLFITEVGHFTDMILIGYDAAAGMALFLEQDQHADR
jgi:hypothetical protein